MTHDDQEEDFDDDFEDDEPLVWEVLEAKYGRELTEAEVRLELRNDYEREFLDLGVYAQDFEDDVARYQDWLVFKEEQRQRDTHRELVSRTPIESKEAAQRTAEDIYYALCSPPLDESGDLPDGGLDTWVQGVNDLIKQRLDFHSLLALEALFRKSTLRSAAVTKADKRHEENRAMKAEVFVWLDQNVDKFRSLDSMAEAIAGKVVPIAFRTARSWVGEHKKLRAAGTE